jgi:integrase
MSPASLPQTLTSDSSDSFNHASLPLRERLIVKLAVLAGMRPGEVFGLRRGHVGESHASESSMVSCHSMHPGMS